MRARTVWKVSVITSAEAEEAVRELLERVLGLPASSYADLARGQTSCSVYLEQRPAKWAAVAKEIQKELTRIAACGLVVAPGSVAIEKLAKQDWAESWKQHFKAIEISPRLLIRPRWVQRKARPGQRVVLVDPGLSFGTGQHPTTRFCLAQIAAARFGLGQSLLDVGTGSGILAIAGVKLGFEPVEAFDYDAEAVRVAKANAHQNRVTGRLRIRRRDLCAPRLGISRRYSVVCANLIANLLLEQQERIIGLVKSNGLLILAGILAAEFGKVQAAYESAGWQLVASQQEGEWRSGSFRLTA